jgi:hypothetical protein
LVPELGFVVVVDVVDLPPKHDTKTTPTSTSTASTPMAAARRRRRRSRRWLRVWRSMTLVYTSLSADRGEPCFGDYPGDVAGVGIDAAFRAHQGASRVDDTADTPFIGRVVEPVRPDTPRSGMELIRIRVGATGSSAVPFRPTSLVTPAGVSRPGMRPPVPRLPDLSESLRQPDTTKPKAPRKPM